MGRPPKSASTTVPVILGTNEGPENVNVTFTNKAFGFFKDQDGIWRVALVEYNPLFPDHGKMSLAKKGDNVIACEDRYDASEQLKIQIAETLFYNE